MRAPGDKKEEFFFHCTPKPSTEKGQKPLYLNPRHFSGAQFQHVKMCFASASFVSLNAQICFAKAFIFVVSSKSVCLFPLFSVSSFSVF